MLWLTTARSGEVDFVVLHYLCTRKEVLLGTIIRFAHFPQIGSESEIFRTGDFCGENRRDYQEGLIASFSLEQV